LFHRLSFSKKASAALPFDFPSPCHRQVGAVELIIQYRCLTIHVDVYMGDVT
jgi:hypothetical protein